MPIIIEDLLIETEPPTPRQTHEGEKPREPSPAERLVDACGAADRRARLLVD